MQEERVRSGDASRGPPESLTSAQGTSRDAEDASVGHGGPSADLPGARAREEHIRQVLLAVRSVGRLIVQETDPARLIQRACENLTQTLGYHNAWIFLQNEAEEVTFYASSGLDGAFAAMEARLRAKEFPARTREALGRDGTVVVLDPWGTCTDCPLSGAYEGRAGMSHRLSHKGKVYGVLSVSVPGAYVRDPEEQRLFRELAEDLGFALHRIASEEQVRLLTHVLDTSSHPMSLVSRDHRYLAVNEVYAELYGTPREEILGRCVADFCGEACFEAEIRPALDRCLAGETVHYEVMVDFSGRGLRWMAMEYRPYRDRGGEVAAVVSHGIDITDWKAAEEALSQSEERLKLALEGADLGIWDWEVQTGKVTFSARWAEMLGYTPEEIAPCLDTWKGLVHPEDLPGVMEALEAHLEGKSAAYQAEFRMRHRSGDWVWILDKGRVTARDEGGRPLRACGTHLDISERRRARERIQRSESLFRKFFETNVNYCYMISPEGRILDVNLAALAALGYERHELVGEPLAKIYAPECQARRTEIFEMWRRTGRIQNEEMVLRTRSGERRTVLLSAGHVLDPQGRPLHSVSVQTDITERKLAEKRLEQTLEATTGGIWYWDFRTGRLTFSPRYYTMLGYAPDAFPPTFENWLDLIHPEDRQHALAVAQKYLETRPDLYENEFRFRTKTGEYRWIHSRARVAERSPEGEAVLMIGNHEDVTERKLAEEALRASEQRFRSITEQSTDVISLTDGEGVITYVSPACRQVFSAEPGEMEGRHFGEFLDDAFLREALGAFREALEGRPARNIELRMKRRDGTLFYGELSGSRYGSGSLVLIRDITERKRAEEEKDRLERQFRQAQKLESVGRLAGGVAHDFNNMLAVILGHTEMALETLDPADPLHGRLSQIQKTAARSADLVRQLLAFARKQTVAPRVLDLNDTIAGTLKMLRSLIGEDISLVWIPGPRLWPVKMDPSQIDQILANLCVNARDAIADVGKVTIETQNRVLDADHCTGQPECIPGEYLLLAVSDDGCGMDKAVQERLFEPFFTTKDVGKGTGLGLATVYGIVRQNNGFVNVYSETGKGTTFRIYLPRHVGMEAGEKRQDPVRPLKGGRETVLLVEDEPMLREMGKSMLERLGYRVLAAGEPEVALLVARDEPGEIHLLMTDVVMPKMNGRELAGRLQSLRPGLRCLFMSGYTANVIAHHGVLDPGVHFIQKPFSMRDLDAMVREALGGRGV